MNKNRTLIMLLLSTSLAACQSVGRQGSPLWHMTTSESDKIAAYRATCVAYGFKAGTAELSQCIAQESRDSRASANDRMRAIQRANSYNRTINCTSTTTGVFTNTSCR